MPECKRCGSAQTVKNGTVRGKQRYLCKQCGYHFVEGDERETSAAVVAKALCTILQALDAKRYRVIGEYLKRNPALIYRWMHEGSRKYNRRGHSEALQFYNVKSLLKELKRDIPENTGPMLLADNIVDDLYIAVILQRRERR